MESPVHNQRILDQFTRQAGPFSTKPGLANEDLLQLMLSLSEARADDEVLDVACGPGIVACAFAAVVRHVTGTDLTPAMLEQARLLQEKRRLTNVSWQQGDVMDLPYPDGAFSLVLTRFSFHHLVSPARVFGEMVRVCRAGGRVMVADVTPAPAKQAAYDAFENLRDPSHVRSLSCDQLQGLFREHALDRVLLAHCRIEMDLERQLASSFPNAGDAEKIRRLVRKDIGSDRLGIGAHLQGEAIHFAYPVTVLVGNKAG